MHASYGSLLCPVALPSWHENWIFISQQTEAV